MTLAHAFVLGGILGPLDWPELLIILLALMLLFGAKRLPELARGIGKSIREFKKATHEVEEDANAAAADAPAPSKNGASLSAKPDHVEQK